MIERFGGPGPFGRRAPSPERWGERRGRQASQAAQAPVGQTGPRAPRGDGACWPLTAFPTQSAAATRGTRRSGRRQGGRAKPSREAPAAAVPRHRKARRTSKVTRPRARVEQNAAEPEAAGEGPVPPVRRKGRTREGGDETPRTRRLLRAGPPPAGGDGTAIRGRRPTNRHARGRWELGSGTPKRKIGGPDPTSTSAKLAGGLEGSSFFQGDKGTG